MHFNNSFDNKEAQRIEILNETLLMEGLMGNI